MTSHQETLNEIISSHSKHELSLVSGASSDVFKITDLPEDLLLIILEYLEPINYLSFVSSFGRVFRLFKSLTFPSTKESKFIPYQKERESKYIYNVIEYMAYRLRFEDLYKMFPDRKEYDKPRLVDLVLFEPSPDGMYARGYIDNQVRCVRSYMPFDRVKDISLDNGMFTFYEGQYNPYKVFNTNTIKLMVGRSYHRLIDDMFNDLCVINDGYTLTETGDIENYNGRVHANIIREVIYECVITNNRKCWIHIKPYICHTYHHSLQYLRKVIALYDTKDNNVLFWTSEYESFTSPNYSLNVNKIPYLHLR